jgi:hypothetical protein
MTSPANAMHIFLWQIGTVIPIQSMITHIYMPRFQAKSLTIAIVCGNYFRVFPRLGSSFRAFFDRSRASLFSTP